MIQNCLIFIAEVTGCCLIQIIDENNSISLVASLEITLSHSVIRLMT